MEMDIKIKLKQEAVTARPPKSGDRTFILDMRTPTWTKLYLNNPKTNLFWASKTKLKEHGWFFYRLCLGALR